MNILIQKNRIISAFLLLIAISLSCNHESPTVTLNPFTKDAAGTDTGTSALQVQGIYPLNGTTDIPVDTDIIITFSKPVDTATVSANISISGSPAYTISYSAGNRIVILNLYQQFLLKILGM